MVTHCTNPYCEGKHVEIHEQLPLGARVWDFMATDTLCIFSRANTNGDGI